MIFTKMFTIFSQYLIFFLNVLETSRFMQSRHESRIDLFYNICVEINTIYRALSVLTEIY